MPLCFPLMLHFDALFATGMPLKAGRVARLQNLSLWQGENEPREKDSERGREAAAAASSLLPLPLCRCIILKKKERKEATTALNCSISLREQKRGIQTLTHFQTQDSESMFIWAQCASKQKPQIFLQKQMCKEEQWGSPSFVCEPACLGFSICISRLFTALKQVDDKNINLSRHIVWHARFDTLPSPALYCIITLSYSLLTALRMNADSKGNWRTSVYCWGVLL